MGVVVCPAITARNIDEYGEQMRRLAGFATRVHIDVADGVFTPVKLLDIKDVWWPGGVSADLHVIYQEPFRHTKELIRLQPQLIIVHAEADGDFMHFADSAHSAGIQVGVALKPSTPVQMIAPALDVIDHVLVFSGHLGHFGGEANTHLLTKVLHLKQLKPTLEIGWEGGINNKNAAILASGGVDVLNAGGFIQHAADPKFAFQTLQHGVMSLPHKRKRV
jgi:ribulose-phosphate 3-epimerase